MSDVKKIRTKILEDAISRFDRYVFQHSMSQIDKALAKLEASKGKLKGKDAALRRKMINADIKSLRKMRQRAVAYTKLEFDRFLFLFEPARAKELRRLTSKG